MKYDGRMKHHFEDVEKPKKKITRYAIIGVAVIVAIVILILAVSLLGKKDSGMSIKGGLSVRLLDSNIKSNDTTYLLVGVKNDEDEPFEGKIRFSADDPENVKITYDEPSLLSFRLLPDESVVRKLEVTGFSKAVRTDYEIKVELITGNSSIVDVTKAILSVKK